MNKKKEFIFQIEALEYLALVSTNINYEGLDIKKKINFYKTKYNEYISPEETHFKAVDFIQKVEISKYNIK